MCCKYFNNFYYIHYCKYLLQQSIMFQIQKCHTHCRMNNSIHYNTHSFFLNHHSFILNMFLNWAVLSDTRALHITNYTLCNNWLQFHFLHQFHSLVIQLIPAQWNEIVACSTFHVTKYDKAKFRQFVILWDLLGYFTVQLMGFITPQ